MDMRYLPLTFSLVFATPVSFDVEPLFIMRSILGRSLRSLCCISHQSECGQCTHHKNCIYTFMFETILDKDSAIGKGRDRASHPFVLALDSTLGDAVVQLDFTMTLLGKAVEYAPYIYAAFVRAGGWGILRDRIPFQIKSVKSQGKDLLDEHTNFNFADSIMLWEPTSGTTKEIKQGEILVKIETPLRFKTNGRYKEDFSAVEFIACLQRRMFTMCTLYGEGSSIDWNGTDSQFSIEKRNLRWKDLRHYSARQRNSMVLGGVVGDFVLLGRFAPIELDLLHFAHLFNAGKNSSFGLGRISVWERLS